MRRFAFPLLVLCACSDDPAPAPAEEPPNTTTTELIHLVTDMGTTGTRFCVFISKSDVDAKGAKTCSEPREFRLFRDGEKESHCISRSSADSGSTKLPVNASGGLQDLAADPEKGRALVEGAVAQIDGALGSRTKKLAGAALLGTAGFRDANGAVDDSRFGDLFGAVGQVFSSRQIPFLMRTLKLEEEARFAWTTIRFLHLKNEPFSIIETGGGACHFATGAVNAEFKDVQTASDNFGTSRLWQTYASDDLKLVEIPTLKDPAFKVCYSGSSTDATGQDAAGCVAFLRAKHFDAGAMAAKAKEINQPTRALFGMGPAWNGMFTTYFPGKASATVTMIHDAAVAECALPQGTAKGFIKQQSCYALSFQEAFLRTAAGDSGTVTNGIESWPRGASVSPGGEFPGCKDASIRVTVEE